MPTYVYRCDDCSHELETHQNFKDDPISVCPECQSHSFYRVPQLPYVMVRGSDRESLGTFAEKNSKRMGKELIQKKTEENKTKTREALKLPPGAKKYEPKKSKHKAFWRGDKPYSLKEAKEILKKQT